MRRDNDLELYMKKTGKKFKNVRLKKRKSIPDVATESGFSIVEIMAIEHGKFENFEIRELYKLCEYYKVNSYKFLVWD